MKLAYGFIISLQIIFACSQARAQKSEINQEAAKLWAEQVKEDQAKAEEAKKQPPKPEEKKPEEAKPGQTISDITSKAEEKPAAKTPAKKGKKGKGKEADPKDAKAAKAEETKEEAKPEPAKAAAAPADDDVTVKVIKARAGKALILHSKKIRLEKKRYSLGAFKKPGEDDDDPSRRWFLGGSLDMGLFSQTISTTAGDTKSDYKSFNLNMAFGRNWGRFEAGPFVEYAFLTVGNNDTKTLLGGILLDINFGVNDLDSDGILGVRLTVGMGQEDASTLTEAAKVMRLQASLFFKWFVSESAAVVIEAGYRNQSADYGTQKVVSTGPVSRIGVLGYF